MSPEMRSRHLRLPLVAAVALAAAGCSAREDARSTHSLEAFASSSPASPARDAGPARDLPVTRELPVSAALLRLPPGTEAAVSVREHRESGRRMQEIALGQRQGGTQNRLLLSVHSGRAPAAARPTEAGIGAELAEAFPGERARVLTQPRHNGFGPYGLALIAGPGARRCVYAWQWLDGGDRRVRDRLGGDASWRGLICRDDATLDQIAAGLDRLDIGSAGPERLRGQTLPAAARQVARAPARTGADAPAIGQARSQPAPEPTYGGGRYLAPLTALPPGAPQPAGSAPPALDPSLPAEAYRGPTVRSPAGGAVRVIALHGRMPAPTD